MVGQILRLGRHMPQEQRDGPANLFPEIVYDDAPAALPRTRLPSDVSLTRVHVVETNPCPNAACRSLSSGPI
jgi:hypothetical protein